MSNPADSGAPPPRLPQYVGVKEVCGSLNISRSTLDRKRRDGGFPQAEQLSPNRVGWRLETIENFHRAQFEQLATHAVTDAVDLSIVVSTRGADGLFEQSPKGDTAVDEG